MTNIHAKIIRSATTLVAIIVALTACSTDGHSATTTTSDTSTSSPSTTGGSTSTTLAQNVDVQSDIDWFISVLNGEELTEVEYESRFSESFRAQVPYSEGMIPVLEQLRPAGPYTVLAREGGPEKGEAVVEAEDGSRARVLAEVNTTGQLTALLIQPADVPTLDDPPATVTEAFERLGALGEAKALTAEMVDGACVPIDSIEAGEPAPLGSVFKLYVLAALGEAVASGAASWDDELVIRDELKSIPSGVLQDREDGDVVTLEEAAQLMISISDNTATDHLIDYLGRAAVEDVLSEYGNTTPELNIPFLTTRELAALKVGPASGLRAQWIAGDEEQRRAILDQISDITPADLPVQEWIDPVDPDLVEWFASPNDLCELAAGLFTLDSSDPMIGQILSINPGVPAEPSTWQSIWFKGGSEPGLVATWFVTRSGDKTFVTVGSVVDPNQPIDEEEAILLMAAARDLLAP